MKEPKLRVGDWVVVRDREEILRTLDKKGQLDGMPFMPEMFAYCGKSFRVFKRAHKTCDTVGDYKSRKLKDAVHLDGIRCDGQAHGGCEALCLIFWKTCWLRTVDPTVEDSIPQQVPGPDGPHAYGGNAQCTTADVLACTTRTSNGNDSPAYTCQATQLPEATQPLPWWEWSQYLEDYTSGNVSLGRMAKTFAHATYRWWIVNLGIGIGPAARWLYDRFQEILGGVPYPHKPGKIPMGERTPAITLDLQPGEWVRVKSHDAIRATCDTLQRNRGLWFDAEMVPYCGGTYRVLRRVTKILDEKTGKMQEMKTPCIILDSVVCQARYANCRLFCPRSIHPYWREIWLERIDTSMAVEIRNRQEIEG